MSKIDFLGQEYDVGDKVIYAAIVKWPVGEEK